MCLIVGQWRQEGFCHSYVHELFLAHCNLQQKIRECLQIESASIPVEAQIRLLDALGETGAKTISIGSFAHPKWTPSMACIDEIAQRFVPKPGVTYTAAAFKFKCL